MATALSGVKLRKRMKTILLLTFQVGTTHALQPTATSVMKFYFHSIFSKHITSKDSFDSVP